MARQPYSYIEPKIQPLVEALNRLVGVKTIASCQGHITRIDHPYVYMSCPIEIAEALAARLIELWRHQGLHHHWHLTGTFNEIGKLCFVLEAPRLDHGTHGFVSMFIRYVLLRKWIDRDLAVLAEHLTDIETPRLVHPGENRYANGHDEEPDQSVHPFGAGSSTDRVPGLADGARPDGIGSKPSSADMARNHGDCGHEGVLSVSKAAAKVAPLVVICIGLAAGAAAHAAEVSAVCFTPGQDCTGLIVHEIEGARRQILVQAYSFTSRPIGDALAAAERRGVDVRVIVDGSELQRGDRGDSQAPWLARQGVPVLVDTPPDGIAHSKVIFRTLALGAESVCDANVVAADGKGPVPASNRTSSPSANGSRGRMPANRPLRVNDVPIVSGVFRVLITSEVSV